MFGCTMARDYTTQAIVGVTQEDKTTSSRIQEWVQEHSGDVEPLSSWTSEVTRHKIVNVAFGEGVDPSEFEVSKATRMVVTRDDHAEVTSVSNRYNLVDNKQVVETLADVLDNFNLQDNVYGEGRNYQDKVAVDVFFDTHSSVFSNDYDNSMEFGVSVRSANDKSLSVQIEPIVSYPDGTVLRGIEEAKKKFKHTKAEDKDSVDMYDQMYEMFGEAIFNLGYLADSFIQNVKTADSFIVDFEQEEFTIEEFYEEWISNPTDAIIEEAVHRAQVEAGLITDSGAPDENPSVTAYNLIYGFTYAVNHASSVTDGSTRDRWHKTAREGLSSPDMLLNEVRASYTPEAEEDSEDLEDTAKKSADIQAELDKLQSP